MAHVYTGDYDAWLARSSMKRGSHPHLFRFPMSNVFAGECDDCCLHCGQSLDTWAVDRTPCLPERERQAALDRMPIFQINDKLDRPCPICHMPAGGYTRGCSCAPDHLDEWS